MNGTFCEPNSNYLVKSTELGELKPYDTVFTCSTIH